MGFGFWVVCVLVGEVLYFGFGVLLVNGLGLIWFGFCFGVCGWLDLGFLC